MFEFEVGNIYWDGTGKGTAEFGKEQGQKMNEIIKK